MRHLVNRTGKDGALCINSRQTCTRAAKRGVADSPSLSREQKDLLLRASLLHFG